VTHDVWPTTRVGYRQIPLHQIVRVLVTGHFPDCCLRVPTYLHPQLNLERPRSPGPARYTWRHQSRPRCDSIFIVATHSGLEAALGRTSGTVTAFLEQLVGEPIDTMR
jgi:hypothetical protein